MTEELAFNRFISLLKKDIKRRPISLLIEAQCILIAKSKCIRIDSNNYTAYYYYFNIRFKSNKTHKVYNLTIKYLVSINYYSFALTYQLTEVNRKRVLVTPNNATNLTYYEVNRRLLKILKCR